MSFSSLAYLLLCLRIELNFAVAPSQAVDLFSIFLNFYFHVICVMSDVCGQLRNDQLSNIELWFTAASDFKWINPGTDRPLMVIVNKRGPLSWN